MAKRKVNITNNSISNTVTKDINKAICEYLWNGFDANASQLSIKYTKNAFNITSLEILDNEKVLIGLHCRKLLAVSKILKSYILISGVPRSKVRREKVDIRSTVLLRKLIG